MQRGIERGEKACRLKSCLAMSSCSNGTGRGFLPLHLWSSCDAESPLPAPLPRGRWTTKVVPWLRALLRQVSSLETNQAQLQTPPQAFPSPGRGMAMSHTHPQALQPLPCSQWGHGGEGRRLAAPGTPNVGNAPRNPTLQPLVRCGKGRSSVCRTFKMETRQSSVTGSRVGSAPPPARTAGVCPPRNPLGAAGTPPPRHWLPLAMLSSPLSEASERVSGRGIRLLLGFMWALGIGAAGGVFLFCVWGL